MQDHKLVHMFEQLMERTHIMSIQLQALVDAVNNDTSAVNSAVTLLNGLTAEIATISAASSDTATQAQLDSLVETINGEATTLATSVANNTPAQPPIGGDGSTGSTAGTGTDPTNTTAGASEDSNTAS